MTPDGRLNSWRCVTETCCCCCCEQKPRCSSSSSVESVAITSVTTTTTSVSDSLESRRTQPVVVECNKSANEIPTCTSRGPEEDENTAIIAQNEVTKQVHLRSSYRHSYIHDFPREPHSVDSDDNNNKEHNSIIVISLTITDNIQGNMVRFAMINENPWWTEQEPSDNQEDVDLSPQMIKTTTDLFENKNNNDIPSDLREEVELFPNSEKAIGLMERRDEEEEKMFFLSENLHSFLLEEEQTNKWHGSRNDKSDYWTSGVDAKDSTEDQYAGSECGYNGGHEDSSQSESKDNDEDSDEDDNSSIASSSSSAVFEFFDDVSLLTNSTDNDDEKDGDEFTVKVHTFEDMSFLTDNSIEQRVEKDVHVMVFSFAQDDLFENRRNKEQASAINDFFVTEEKSVSKALKNHIPLTFLVGICYENGFSPKDELRLA